VALLKGADKNKLGGCFLSSFKGIYSGGKLDGENYEVCAVQERFKLDLESVLHSFALKFYTSLHSQEFNLMFCL